MKIPGLIVFLIIIIINAQTCTSSGDKYYTAAVIEYYPSRNSSLTPEERTVETVRDYMKLLETTDKALDIAVFPESTITVGINTREELIKLSPIVINETVPCENRAEGVPEYFRELSCAAKIFNTYLVANIVEKSECSRGNCASDGYDLYNANVIFDRTGRVVGTYRKFHLYGEFEKNTTEVVDLTTFDADFGVTFGTFICFDILFEEPPLWLTRKGVQHLIFPSMWFSEAPFLTALQVQNMFSVATNSVLLASGANNPKVGSGGSGFYWGENGPVNLGIIFEGGSKIFVEDVPINIATQRSGVVKSTEIIDKYGARADNFYLKRDKLESYSSFLINEDVDATYCHEEFCCKFLINLKKTAATSENYYKYRIFVYSGVRSFDGLYNGGVEICAIAFCKENTVESCGERIFPYESIEWTTAFDKIAITGTFDDTTRKMQYPNSLLSDLEPLGVENYGWESAAKENGKIERKFTLRAPQERLLTFGIYGRDFTRDGAPEKLS